MNEESHPWPSVSAAPVGTAKIKSQPDDFRVREVLGFEPSGQGQHAYLRIEKRNLTTDDVVKHLRRQFNLQAVAIGYAGLKDKVAVTEQWLSIDLRGGPDMPWHRLENANLRILDVTRHTRKIKIGALTGNGFEVFLRDFSGDLSKLNERLAQIREQGVPNYFGEQRFGRDGANIERARAFFENTYQPRNHYERGILLSSARSWIFNHVLAERVLKGTWNKIGAGDVMMLAGSQSIFPVAEPDDTLRDRVLRHDIHPTGPLWGIGQPPSGADILALEKHIGQQFEDLCAGLSRHGLEQARRRLVLVVNNVLMHTASEGVKLSFELEAGAYATTVLREVVRAMPLPDIEIRS